MRRGPGHPGPRTGRTWDTGDSKRPRPRSIAKLGEPRTRRRSQTQKNLDRSKPGRGASQTQDTSPGRGTGAESNPLAAEFCQTLSLSSRSFSFFFSFSAFPVSLHLAAPPFFFHGGRKAAGIVSRLPPSSEPCGGSPRSSLGTPSEGKKDLSFSPSHSSTALCCQGGGQPLGQHF